VPKDRFPADYFNSFKTSESKLSIWKLESHEDLTRAVTTLAAARNKPERFDFFFLSEADLLGFGFTLIHKPNRSLDVEFGRSNHFDLVKLTNDCLCRLIRSCIEKGVTGRYLKNEVVEMIVDGFANKTLDQSLVKKTAILSLAWRLRCRQFCQFPPFFIS
jgi:hypothetical protein